MKMFRRNYKRSHSRRLLGLSLALAGLMIPVVLPLAGTTVVASVTQPDPGSLPSRSRQENPLSFNKWTSNGPDTSIDLLAIDPSNPNTVYAVDNGVLKSTNVRETWSGIKTV